MPLPLVDHAHAILDFLANRRDAVGRIAPIFSRDLLIATGRNPPDYAVVYGQANSLLDIACLKAKQPLIGRLVLFDHHDLREGPWANWVPFESLLYTSAPRLKLWCPDDIGAICGGLSPGRPSDLWHDMECRSEELLSSAVEVAQGVIERHVLELIAPNPPAPGNTRQPAGG